MHVAKECWATHGFLSRVLVSAEWETGGGGVCVCVCGR